MYKVWLIVQREFLNRVRKRSFLIATILVPLIFPLVMSSMVYFSDVQKQHATKKVIQYVDESKLFRPDTAAFHFSRYSGTLADARKRFEKDKGKIAGLLYIPAIDVMHPAGITLYSKANLSPGDLSSLRTMLEDQIRDVKMTRLKVDRKLLNDLETNVSIEAVRIEEDGQEKSSNTEILFTLGMVCGILMYMLIFIYGAQIMHGVIEEKTSKVVEVIVSSVRPFQLMMGKIVGLGSVGLLQFLIWIILITVLSTVMVGSFRTGMPGQQAKAVEQVVQQKSPAADTTVVHDTDATMVMKVWKQIPVTYMVLNFLFFFLGGYLLYGALFAAVGASVDSPAEAQQFLFPITIPMLVAYLSLFTFILEEHDSTISVWLSIIPFTSPIAMIGRLGFGVPLWQLILSQVLLIAGFIFTTWVAARIYRVGILMHGTKVNYRVLIKWFMMRH